MRARLAGGRPAGTRFVAGWVGGTTEIATDLQSARPARRPTANQERTVGASNTFHAGTAARRADGLTGSQRYAIGRHDRAPVWIRAPRWGGLVADIIVGNHHKIGHNPHNRP